MAGRHKYIPSQAHLKTASIGAKKGLSNQQIAEAIGVGLTTFKRNLHIFKEVLDEGRSESDDALCERAESALQKKMLGYEYTEVHKEIKKVPFVTSNANGKKVIEYKESVQKRTITKWYPPSDTAIIFYLVNRSNGRWESVNNRVDIETTKLNRDDMLKFMNEMTNGK